MPAGLTSTDCRPDARREGDQKHGSQAQSAGIGHWFGTRLIRALMWWTCILIFTEDSVINYCLGNFSVAMAVLSYVNIGMRECCLESFVRQGRAAAERWQLIALNWGGIR
jgi:hypothetical protein